jgi:hypothetical protein
MTDTPTAKLVSALRRRAEEMRGVNNPYYLQAETDSKIAIAREFAALADELEAPEATDGDA